MHVYLTGANGFVGSYILRELVAQGHTARCLLRDPSEPLAVEGDAVERVKGDVTKPKTFAGTMRGCDAVIHLVGIIDEKPAQGVTFEAIHYEGTKHVVDEAMEAGVERFIQMSANGAAPDGVSRYQTTKWKAEEYVKQADFRHWTIFRPSIVFGDPGPERVEFATRLAQQLVKPFPILPIFGDGQYELQPVSVEEVAAAFVQALTNEAAAGETYCTAGHEAYPYTEILDRIARGLGLEPKPKIPQPVWMARAGVNTLGRLGLLPISPDQFEMLLQGNTCDEAAFYRDFDVTFKPFSPENLGYLRD
ncbi:MAG: complex I NDUFA9 subunit family protein [Rhodothermales bacterium]|nr:complex I NDUFA9 subunit family protein [Rhodothermales bacterium]